MFLDDVLRSRKIIQPQEGKTKDVSVLSALGSSPVHDFGDQGAINQLYDNIIWTYRSIGFIASNLATVPWKVYKKTPTKSDPDEKIDVTDSPQFEILKKPNRFQTLYDFKFESYARLSLQGELFWELDYRPAINKILGIYADWRSEEVKILPDSEFMIAGYERNINGNKITYQRDQIIYLKYFNPYDALRGLSPLRPSRHSSTMELNAIGFNKNFFKQGARPSGVLTTDQKLNTVEEERLREQIRSKYQSLNQMHEIMVLWGGLSFTPLNTMSMTDMQFQQLREMNREEIIAGFGLSLEVLGLGQKTYENVKYYRRLAWTETLIPLNKKFSESLTMFLIPKLIGRNTGEYVIEPDYSKVEALKEDRSQKTKDYSEGFKSGALTPNDIRQDVFGKDPIKMPEMDMTYLPFNVMPMGVESVGQQVRGIIEKKKESTED